MEGWEFMKKQSFWTLFQLVVIIVTVMLSWAYFRVDIQRIWQQPGISSGDAWTQTLRLILDLPNVEPLPPVQQTLLPTTERTAPHAVASDVQQMSSYQQALKVAQQFNETIDFVALNIHWVNEVNGLREAQGWQPLVYGNHLISGTYDRAKELAENYYLSSQTVTGESFRVMHPNIWQVESRLGESTFELYISATDVHITTWQKHPDVLATYIVKAFKETLLSEVSADYASQAIVVYMVPSDQQVEGTPYVRLVAVLTQDVYITND